jgi:hypothetical protein
MLYKTFNIIKIFFLLLASAQIFFLFIFIIFPIPANAATPQLQIKIPYVEFSEPVACGTDYANRTVYCNKWLGQYISGIYKYALGVLGILAALAMMIGGIIWLTAGGDAGKVTTAKSWITGSITGLVIGFSSYFILYQINPDLIKLPSIRIAKVEKAPETKYSTNSTQYYNCAWKDAECTTLGMTSASNDNQCDINASPCTAGSAATCYCCCLSHAISTAEACQKYASNNVIDFKKITDNTSLPLSCGSYDDRFKSVAGNAKIGETEVWKILKALAATESTCNAMAKSDKGACGLMQLKEETAGVKCEDLINDPKLSIQKAYNYIMSHQQSDIYNQFAGYNTGYASTGKGALASSIDCPGVLKYQCCLNPGELDQTQDHVSKSVKYYNTIKNQ